MYAMTGDHINNPMSDNMNNKQSRSLVTYNHITYLLYVLSYFTAGLLWIVPIFMNYAKRRDADGTWLANGNFCLLDIPLVDLEGKTLGIIGVGTIGKRVTEIARAFGMTVLWSEHQGRVPRNSDYTAFDDVLARSDVISLHCPLNEHTQHLINKDTLAKMGKQPLLVNVARGGIVDTQALTDAIDNEQIMGYASDVFEQEPIADNDPLLSLSQHPRVIFSPHNAWGSKSAQETLWQILSGQVTDFINKNS